MNFLRICDAPAWLLPTPLKQCYDATRVQSLKIKSIEATKKDLPPDIQIALLCRHKLVKSDKQTDYDDVAMIINNKSTGKTCWFQTEDGESGGVAVEKNGDRVPAPDLDNMGFWLKPSATAGVGCASCHDNGPWMNSQWLYSQDDSFKNKPGNPYSTPKFAAGGVDIFGDWPKTDDFVSVGKAGLLPPDASVAGNPAVTKKLQDAQKNLLACTSCHKLSSKIEWPGFTKSVSQTWETWFDFTTGKVRPDQAGTMIAGDYDHTRWMPTDRRPEAIAPLTAEGTYDLLYAKHFAWLKYCMKTPLAIRAISLLGVPCYTKSAALGNLAFNSNPMGVGASISATVLGSGKPPYKETAVPLAAATPPVPVPISPGTMLLLGWQADNTFEACTIEATTPPGVLVTSPGGPAIGTGSNWALPQAPLELGPLTVNGVYDFSIYCRDTYTASLQFQLGSDPAISGPSMLLLATSVNDTVEATAVDSVSAKESTTTDVPVSSPVELNWIAYNVQPGTCLLGGPGVTEASEVGSTTVAVSGPADQEFTFACMGTDFVSRSVSSTLHPTP